MAIAQSIQEWFFWESLECRFAPDGALVVGTGSPLLVARPGPYGVVAEFDRRWLEANAPGLEPPSETPDDPHRERFGLFETWRFRSWVGDRVGTVADVLAGDVGELDWLDSGWRSPALEQHALTAASFRLFADATSVAPPEVVELQQIWFRESGGCPVDVAWNPDVYRRWYAKDARVLRAAALAGACVRALAGPHLEGLLAAEIGVPVERVQWLRLPGQGAAITAAQRVHFGQELGRILAEALEEWRVLLSPDGRRSYRSLDRTLSNLPWIPTRAFPHFRRRRLDRARTQENELMLFLTLAARDITVDPSIESILLNADEPSIDAALRVALADVPFGPRQRIDAIQGLVRLVADLQGPYGGKLSGLVRRALRRERGRDHGTARGVTRETLVERLVCEHGPLEAIRYPPPVHPVTADGVRRIEGPAEQLQIADRFRNCLADLIPRAMTGETHYFTAVLASGGEAVGAIEAGGGVEVEPLSGRLEDLEAAKELERVLVEAARPVARHETREVEVTGDDIPF